MLELAGKCAVVTGAASGIGQALAHAFAAEGMRVAIADVEADALFATEADLCALGASVLAMRVDVSDASSVGAFAQRVDNEFDGADVVCNNAGVFAGGLTWERPVADFEWVMGVNFYGILHGIQAFVPGMIERGRPGHVVNTMSAAGLFPSAFSAPYTASKFAALALTECLAGELATVGAPIGVTALCPGAVKTGIASSARNRAELTATDPASEFVDRMLAENTERGMPPSDLAVMVVEAVCAGRYLQLTADGYATALRTRTDELLAGGVPSLPHFD
jgi:NAD(P)-dependent dehydrogenase (short-subunit alcohol dehydrogenase family)